MSFLTKAKCKVRAVPRSGRAGHVCALALHNVQVVRKPAEVQLARAFSNLPAQGSCYPLCHNGHLN